MTQGRIIENQGAINIRRNRFENRDIISTMPNDIIGNIVSRLEWKDAVRTSVLATKWRYHWTLFDGVLDFDISLRNLLLRREHVGLLTRCIVFTLGVEKFNTFMANVMNTTLKSTSIQGLRICTDLGDPWRLAEWIKYAAEKNVQTLDLDFSYHFLAPFIEISETIRNVLPSNSFQMKSLCNLRLSSVDVTGEIIESLLACCPLLESISVIESKRLMNLKVQGEGLRLKHLELVECHILNLFISSKNLLTFRYSGDYGKIKFEHVPSLVEASFGGIFCSYMQSNVEKNDFYAIVMLVDVLKLEMSIPYPDCLEDLPVFHNVRQLEFRIPHECGAPLGRAVTLLRSFPSISVLKIKFQRTDISAVQIWVAHIIHEYPNLRELEVSGYRKDPSQIELLTSIFEHAPNLNKVVVDPLCSMYVNRSPAVKTKLRELNRENTTWLADSLKPYLPPLAELIVL